MHLRSPNSGLLGQLVRFGLSGATVALLYITVTTVLSQVLGAPFQLALVIGFAASLALHFTLQRAFVWVGHEEFALEFRHQAGRYLLMAAAQYATTAASTYWLPSALGVATEIVYLVTFCIVTATGFVVMRLIIFHGDEPLLGEGIEPGYRSNTPTTFDDPSA